MELCKSVPDFDSVGAMWVDVTDINHDMEKSWFRGTGPLTWFPRVHNGESEAKSIQTTAFKELEQLMRNWTRKL